MRTDFCPHYFLFTKRRCFVISKQDIQINEEIRDNELRVISSNGDQLGIMSASEALDLAVREDLDLVKIAPQ
jgi:translation initiation factor IF-3